MCSRTSLAGKPFIIPSHYDLIWCLRPQSKTSTFPTCAFYPRNPFGSDIILYTASCHAGARLFRSLGVSLVPHPICRVLAMTGWPAVRMRSSKLGPHTLSAVTAQPAHRTPRGPPCLVHGGAPSLQRTDISLYHFLSAPYLFYLFSYGPFHCATICHHFQTFQTDSALFYDECL